MTLYYIILNYHIIIVYLMFCMIREREGDEEGGSEGGARHAPQPLRPALADG